MTTPVWLDSFNTKVAPQGAWTVSAGRLFQSLIAVEWEGCWTSEHWRQVSVSVWSLKGRERAIINQTNVGSASEATLGKLLRDGVERIWTFPGAYIPSCSELFMVRCFIQIWHTHERGGGCNAGVICRLHLSCSPLPLVNCWSARTVTMTWPVVIL